MVDRFSRVEASSPFVTGHLRHGKTWSMVNLKNSSSKDALEGIWAEILS
jgi:hypothetical protein